MYSGKIAVPPGGGGIVLKYKIHGYDMVANLVDIKLISE
jgi:hypothetical protein